MKKCWIGIDPGSSSGAAAAITEDGIIKTIRFSKTTEKEWWVFFANLAFDYECFCTTELVGVMPGQGIVAGFSFGKNVGFILGLLTASGIPYEQKVPRSWQKELGITPRFKPKKGESGTEETKPEFKKRLKAKAEQLFPKEKVLTDTADALLIMEYTRRTHK
jgi:hypothetical protein